MTKRNFQILCGDLVFLGPRRYTQFSGPYFFREFGFSVPLFLLAQNSAPQVSETL